MAENYGTLEGTLDEHGVLSGEMSDRATLEGEIQFGSGGGGVLDVFQNGQSVVQGRYAYVTVPTFLKDLRADDYHNTVTTLEIQNWNGKADPDDIPTKLSQLDNDANYVQDADYVHTDNNFTDEDKAAIGNIPENITDLSDVEVDNIQNGQVLKWDATQEKFVNANESGGGGDITDVKVDGISVVDPVTGEADIDLSGKADKALDAVAGDFAVLLANGNYANSGKSANDMASKAEMSVNTSGTQTTVQLKNGTSATINNPTITIQKNGQNVDTFTLNQPTNKVINISVPTKTSDLQNDSSFITNTVDNLANYYLKSQTYTQAEVDALIDAAVNGRFQKVNVLPATGEPNIIYLVPKVTPETSNACDEYIWQDNAWELIGSTNIDLSGYVTDDELNTALADYLTTSAFNTAIANYYTKTEVGNLLDDKVDKISGKGLSTNDYDNTAKGIVDGVTAALADKVDKETGKGLSTNDYTTTEKNKLAGIAAGATKTASSTTNGNIKINDVETQVYDDSEIQDKIDETTTSISGNPISISGLKANQLAKDPIITLNPIQDLHGQSKPYPAGGGKNKFNIGWVNTTSFNVSGTTITTVAGSYNKDLFSGITGESGASEKKLYLAAGTYTISFTTTGFTDFQSLYISAIDDTTLVPLGGIGRKLSGESFTLVSASWVCIKVVSNQAGTIKNLQIESGSPATSYAPYENICPISGYDKVEALSCGANVWDETWELGGLIWNTGEEATANDRIRTDFIIVIPDTNYYIYSNSTSITQIGIIQYDKNKDRITNSFLYASGSVTINANTKYIRIVFVGITSYSSGISVNYPSTVRDYVPYHKTTDISESLGQTVYGGTLDVRTGKLTVTHGKKRMDGNDTFGGSSVGTNAQLALSDMKVGRWSGDEMAVCDSLPRTSQTSQLGFNPGANNNTVYFYNLNTIDASINSSATLNAYLANHPIEFTYPLATPIEIQLTPHEISLLKDYAYVSTNGTSIALDYHNGELASLGDVSQLGETVNELGEYVGRNNAYSYVDLTSISYEFPNDGYIVVDSQAVTSGAVRVQLTGYNGSFAIGGIYMNITGAYQIQTTFVKKGMRARVIQDVTGVRKRFVPLV